jgi:acetolactate synthase-1/2/3 large subunit
MIIDLEVNSNAKDFLQSINKKISGINLPRVLEWKKKITEWKNKFPICDKGYFEGKDINPYAFVKIFSDEVPPGEVIFTDTGCSVAWVLQSFEFKKNQRLFSAFNNTPMGYALPASIGASFALGKKPVICVTGDGGLQMNIQELATVTRHNLPIKIFLFNNHGYSMIRQTQDQWFCSQYEASTVKSGLAFPDFIKIAKVYGFATVNITKLSDIRKGVRRALRSKAPVLCNIEIRPEYNVVPQVKFGRAIEDAEPLLSRKDFLDCMIVKPLTSSLH